MTNRIVCVLVVALAATAPIAAATGHMTLKSYTTALVGTAPANGDNDGFADANETIDLSATLINKTGLNLTNVVARLVTYDPTIACIGTYEVTLPAVAAGATFTLPAFRFRVGDSSVVNRTNADQVIQATFDVRVHSDQFDSLDTPIGITLSLDLSASGGSGTSAWVESFEIGGTNFGRFTLATLDAGKNSLALSDGMRCQYTDPDGLNSITPNDPDCFLGFAADTSAGVNDWHVHDATPASGGLARAYAGSKSLHWGVHNASTPRRDTVRLKQLDAMKSVPVNLPLANVVPELVFAHQVSFVDNRGVPSADFGWSLDRAVVEINVLSTGGAESPVWRKLSPYANEYESTGAHGYANCMFDPTDDGNNEDSYFDPTDPDRRLGPSSTCYPDRVFGCVGDTDYHLPANPASLCRTGDGPGLPGSIDIGTWVQPRFNLQEFAGRRIKLRFLATSFELGIGATWDTGWFNRDDVVADDGWYIDDVRVNQALGVPLTLAADTKTITAIPCDLCTSISAAMEASPTVLSTPGEVVTFDAGASAVSICPTSPPRFQYWIDGNDNGVAGDAGDTVVRDWSEDPVFLATPEASNTYAVLVRCPSAPDCDASDGSDTVTASVTVNCPTGVTRLPFAQTIYLDQATIHWQGPDSVDVLRGWFVTTPEFPMPVLRETGSFATSELLCLKSDSIPINVFRVFEWPSPGTGLFYLVRGQAASGCPALPPGYSSNAPSERPGRDAEIDADPGACP